MASARPLNYTTTISVDQTAGECSAMLARAGAAAVAIEYQEAQPVGLSFRLDTPHGRRDFTLPVNIDGMQRVLSKAEAAGELLAKRKQGAQSSRDQSARVAWRVIKDWLEANLALIAARMATLDEVMLPYLMVDDSRTLHQAYRAREQSLELAAGGTPGGDR